MKLIRKGEGKGKTADRHFGQWGVGAVGPDIGAKRLNVGISHFLPGIGGAEFYSSPTERIYYGIRGALKVKGNNEEHVVREGDILFIAPGEERSIEVEGTEPVTTLVVIVKMD
jgi:quercetin dioxygenase-like cupin family protein